MTTLEGYKIISAEEMARIEKLSIQEGASDEAYMLKAGAGIAKHVKAFIEKNHREKKVILLVGKGNNGGDAFVAGHFLLKEGFTVRAYHVFSSKSSRPLNQKYEKQFREAGGELLFPKKGDELVFFPKGVILDGLLGTGFQGEIADLLLSVITHANQCKIPILAIDIPSGLNGNTGAVHQAAIRAKETYFLGMPKIGFFLGSGYNYIGNLVPVDFGMKIQYLHAAKASAHLLNEKVLPDLLPPLIRSRHKYEAGYVLAISGSPSMPGAALLSSLAALRTGAGIVRLFHPLGMEAELVCAPYEIMRTPYKYSDPTPILLELSRASALLIGPGLGKSKEMGEFLNAFVDEITVPTVIDADGLFHLKDKIASLKMPCILTPHEKEMLRLLGKERFDEGKKLSTCQKYVEKHRVTVVLKGGPTIIFHPKTTPLIIAHGDPGMATAGTGDILTGILAALLSQKMQPKEAAALGVYIHARAGEIAALQKTSYDLIASDLIQMLPQVFSELISSV